MSFNLAQTVADLTDLVAERDGLVAQVASLTTDLAEADTTIADQLAIIASLNTLVDTLEAQLDVLTRVVIALDIPEGTDSGAILYTLPAGSWTVTGVGLAIEGQDVILADKVAFFEQTSPTCAIDGPSKYRLNWTVVPGYYDIGLMGDNMLFWWDMTDNRQFLADPDGYCEILNDKSSFHRHMQNPWYPDRRQTIADSTMKPGLKSLNSVDITTGTTYGLACPEAPIWHGMWYMRFSAGTLELLHAETQDNNSKTIFTGLSTYLTPNQPLMFIVHGDANVCKLRINGIERGSLNAGAGYFPPNHPFCIAFVAKCANFDQVFSGNHIGQHCYWEKGSFTGETVELLQALNVQVAA